MYTFLSRVDRFKVYGAVSLLTAVFIAPMFVALSVALRGQGIGNFVTVLTHPALPGFFINSLIIAAGTTLLVAVVTMTSSYALSKLRPRGSQLILVLIVIGLMVPPAAIFLPLFITIRNMGLLNSHIAVIGPLVALLIPGLVVLTKAYMDSLTDEVIDASKVDGCNSWQTLIWILLPMSRPMLIVVALLAFLSSWNEYFLPLIFLRDESLHVVTMAPLFFVQDEFTQNTGLIFAALILVSAPALILFSLFQRYILEGVTLGSVK